MKLFTFFYACILAVALALGGCCSGEIDTPYGRVSWETDEFGNFVSKGSLPPGHCLEVEFFDSDGNSLGDPLHITPPDVSSAPAGTRSFRARVIDDCDGLLAPAPTATDDRPVGSLRPYDYFGGPLQAEDGGVHFALTIRATDPADAGALVDAVLANMEAAPVPAAVDVHLLQRHELVGADVALTLVEDDTWLDCDVVVNGNTIAQLDDAARGSTNGWDVLTYVVPGSEFEFDPGLDWENEVQFVYATDTEGTMTATFGLASAP